MDVVYCAQIEGMVGVGHRSSVQSIRFLYGNAVLS